MGKIITDPNQLEVFFNTVVETVETAVNEFSFVPNANKKKMNSLLPIRGVTNSINPWMVVEKIEMPFSAGSYGILLEVCAPIFADDAMAMGQHHALGMPW